MIITRYNPDEMVASYYNEFSQCCDICMVVNVCKELDRTLTQHFPPKNGSWSKADHLMSSGDYLAEANFGAGNVRKFKGYISSQIINPRNRLVHHDSSSFVDAPTREGFQSAYRTIFEILKKLGSKNEQQRAEADRLIGKLRWETVELNEEKACGKSGFLKQGPARANASNPPPRSTASMKCCSVM